MNLKNNIVELKIDGKTLYLNCAEYKSQQEFETFLSQRIGYIPKDSKFYEIEKEIEEKTKMSEVRDNSPRIFNYKRAFIVKIKEEAWFKKYRDSTNFITDEQEVEIAAYRTKDGYLIHPDDCDVIRKVIND
jgi:hypothetical protein